MFIAIANQDGFLYSNIPSCVDLNAITAEQSSVYCEIKQINRRQVRLNVDGYLVFVVSYDKNVTNRIFRHYLDALTIQIPIILSAVKEKTTIEYRKTKRLKHNIINYASKIQQELWRLIPQEKLATKHGKESVAFIKESLIAKNELAAHSYVRILKYCNFMKDEFDAYDITNSENPYLDFATHYIYKVIQLSLSVYWLDFAERGIEIEIEQSHDQLNFDYKSISVVLSHIFDNALKYAMPDHKIKIGLTGQGDIFKITFKMMSLKILSEEKSKLTDESYSGEWSRRLQLAGDGIGMNVVKHLIKLNGGTLHIDSNVNSSANRTLNGIPYEENVITIALPTLKTKN